jgi:hypothetical protein
MEWSFRSKKIHRQMHNFREPVGIAAQPESKSYSFGGGFSCSSSAIEKYQFSWVTVKRDKLGKVLIGKLIGCYVKQYIGFEFGLLMAERMCAGLREAEGIEAVFCPTGVKAAGRFSEPSLSFLQLPQSAH